MIFKKEIRKPILALIFISLGGWCLHVRVHPMSVNLSYLAPFLAGLFSFVIVPVLVNYRKTVLIGYLLNGFSAVIGTVLMAYLSLSHLAHPLTLFSVLFQTTLADIFILISKLFIGQIILLHYFPNGLGRMFTAFWWVRHFCYFTVVYSIGHFLLR
jgi:hypothetical protein